MIKTGCPVLRKCECGTILFRGYEVDYDGPFIFEIMECEHVKYECLGCGKTVTKEQYRRGVELAERHNLPKLDRPRCPNCGREDIKVYDD